LGYISLLKDGTFGPMNLEQQEAAEKVIEKIEQVANLIKKMVSVHASNSQNLSLKSTRLEQLASLAVRSMLPKAKASSIQIVPQIPEDLPPALVDRVAISEIFEALIDNAIKFSGEGKVIEISITDPGGPTLQVNIRDQGIGIPVTEHEKVFRRFYQIDGSTTRRYGGTGLGLAIARKVITAHGGRIWLESDLDKGTTVSFTVPKATLEHSPTDTQSAFA
jgi:signal transduction histidine kinase